MTDKLFVVRKYVMASSAQAAIRKEKSLPVDDVWVEEEWKKNNSPRSGKPTGFK